MRRAQSARKSKIGLPPGTLRDLPEAERPKTQIHCINYIENTLEDRDISPEDLPELKKCKGVVWLNVTGIGDGAATRPAKTPAD